MIRQEELVIRLEHELHREVAGAYRARIEQVEPDRPVCLQGIEEHDPAERSLIVGQAIENRADEIPVWIEHAARAAGLDVVENEMEQERGFPHARKTRYVEPQFSAAGEVGEQG